MKNSLDYVIALAPNEQLYITHLPSYTMIGM